MNELIVLKQLPIITQQLEKIKEEVTEKLKIVDEIESKIMDLSEEEQKNQKQTIKDIRTNFANDFKAYEEIRKEIKSQIMKPYDDMELVYRECVTEQYTNAKSRLDSVIDSIESKQKKVLEDKARRYFEEYKISKSIDFLAFEQVGLKIGVSDNNTKLQKLITVFIDEVEANLKLIDTQEFKDEILVEYKENLDVAGAITKVIIRHEKLEEQKAIDEQKQVEVEVQKENPTVLARPTIVDAEELLTTAFTVTATEKKLKELKEFLEKGEYDYE